MSSADCPTPENLRDRGFVLVSVIWIAGLLAVVAAVFVVNVRIELLSAANTVKNAKAETIADGLTHLAAWHLATGVGTDPAAWNGRLRPCAWSEETAASIAIQDQAGLVDLNAAPEDLFARLLTAIGIPHDRALAIAAELQDFRDADSLAALGGAEPATYPGRSFGPKNGPFQAIEELDQLPSLDPPDYRRLLPLVTIHSLQPAPDPARAPAELVKLLGLDPSEESASPAKFFATDILVMLKSGARFRRQAIVTLIRQPDRPYAILAWRRGGDPREATPAGPAPASCLN